MNIPFVDLTPQHNPLTSAFEEAFQKILTHQQFILGPEVATFEKAFASALSVPYAVSVSSGTSALLLSLLALGIGKGDEVITSPFTFIATADVIHAVGATPVFVDIKKDYTLDPSLLEQAITKKTKAVIAVHVFGQPCNVDALEEITKKHSIFLIEDCAQATGATYKGKNVGSMGKVGCFSFFPTKPLGGMGDGGMIVTHDITIDKKIRSLREHGKTEKYYHSLLGGNFRLNTLQAAMLSIKLPYLELWNEERRALAKKYTEAFSSLPLSLPTSDVWHQYVVQTEMREELVAFLEEKNIPTAIHYPLPLHLQPCFSFLKYKEGDFPEAEKAAKHVLSLPIYPGMQQQKNVIESVKAFFSDKKTA